MFLRGKYELNNCQKIGNYYVFLRGNQVRLKTFLEEKQIKISNYVH